MVKTTTPWSVLFFQGDGKWNGLVITEGVVVLTIAQVKAVNICFITPQQTFYHLRTRNARLGTARRVIVVGLPHSKR